MANQMVALQARGPQLPDMGALTARYGNMMAQQQTADRQSAAAQQTAEFARAEEGRKAALQPAALAKETAEATSADIKAGMDFNNFVRLSLANSNTPDQVAAFAERIAAQPQFKSPVFQGILADAVQSMPTEPAAFENWKEQTYRGTLVADKRYEKKLLTQKTGTEERIISVPAFGGAATEVPGSRFASAQDIQYVKGPNGEVIAAPKTMPGTGGFGGGAPAPAAGIVGGPRGGGGGVQFGQIVAGTGGGKRTVAGGAAAAVKPEKPLTQAQAKATGYAMRAQEAEKDLTAIKQFSPSAIASKRYAEDIPVLGALAGPLVNRALSESDQLAEQAQRNFVNAVLRQDSGAAINAGEWANAQRQYFPQPNDKPAVLAQKARNRATAIEALKVGAGAGMRQASAAAAPAKASASKRSTPTPAASGWGKAEVVGK